MMTVEVSVVIPCYEGRERLLGTLREIRKCNPAPQEVIIHADGGWKFDLPAGEVWPWPVRVIESAMAVGPGGGRQRLIREASCEIVASFDDDAWPLDEDYFGRALSIMKALPDVVVLSPAVSGPDTLALPRRAEVGEERSYGGCASIHRKSLHEMLPGFVPVKQAYGLEEADVALQARCRGMKVAVSSWLQAWHNRPAAEDKHGVHAWLRNELVLGWLRYPCWLRVLSWWRAARRWWKDKDKVGGLSLLHAALNAPRVCTELKKYRKVESATALLRHHKSKLKTWKLVEKGDDLRAELLPEKGTVLCIQFTEPAAYPPIEHVAELLANDGWQVECLGLAAGGFRLPRHPRIREYLVPRQMGGWRPQAQYFAWVLRCLWWSRNKSVSWVYASDPFAALPALLSKYLLGKQVVYHEHDCPPLDRRSGLMKLLMGARKRLSRSAEQVVIPAEGRQRGMDVAAELAVVWNVPSLSEVLKVAREPMESGLKVVFHGSVVPGRFPVEFVNMLLLCDPGISLTVMGYEPPGAVGYKAELSTRAMQLGLGERFKTLPQVEKRSTLLECCGTYDVGLALLERRESDLNTQYMAGASNKPFDYASQGLAVIVPDEPEWRRLFVDTGCGLAAAWGDNQGLANQLNKMLRDKKLTRDMGESGRQMCLNSWNYEKQFTPVRARVNNLVLPHVA